MKKILSFLFWRILVPFVLALLLAFAGLTAIGSEPGIFRGYLPGSPVHHAWNHYFYLLLAVFLVVGFVNELRITLAWGNEAEEFESELKEDEVKEEHRRQSDGSQV